VNPFERSTTALALLVAAFLAFIPFHSSAAIITNCGGGDIPCSNNVSANCIRTMALAAIPRLNQEVEGKEERS
jgi:hypothetical protein